MREIDTIVVHCSATPPGMDVDVATIRRWHVEENGWSDIGYHFVVLRSGRVETGRPIQIAGAHVRGHNDRSIGICMVGGTTHDGKSDCNFTAEQWETLHNIVAGLTSEYPLVDVVGHRDLDLGKDCPCFDVRAWWSAR